MRTHVRFVVVAAALAGIVVSAHAQSPAPEPTTAESASQARRAARDAPPNSMKTSACETGAEAGAARELPPEVAARYRAGEIRRALGAWNKDRHPTTACVRVYGPPRTSQQLIATFTGLTPGTRLTNDHLIRARRRLDQLPLSSGTVVAFAPIDAARASVDVNVDDRSVLPAGLVPIGTIVVSGLATQEYKFDVVSPTGRGEDVFTAVRWQEHWHRVQLGLDVPITGRFAGIVTMGMRWERQFYTPSPDMAETLERRSLNVGLSSWATSWFWWHAAAGGDQLNGRTYAAAETAVDSRFFRDHVSVGGNAGVWQGSVTGGQFGRAVGNVSVRSTTREDGPVWFVSAGAGAASENAPLQTWMGAGSRTIGDAVLRAHPLVRDGTVRGSAFGRRLTFGSVEYDRPFWRSMAGPVSWTAFVDGIRGQRPRVAPRGWPGAHALARGCRRRPARARRGPAGRDFDGNRARPARRQRVRLLRLPARVAGPLATAKRCGPSFRSRLMSVNRLRAVLTILIGAGVLSLAAAGCKSSSTEPSGGAPSGTPVILGIVPSQPSLSQSTQMLAVTGHDFTAGMVATMLRPDGRVLSFLTSDLVALTSTSFDLSVVFDLAGDYRLELRNVGGQVSSPFTITVRPAEQGTLTLTSLSPTTTLFGPQPQAIFVTGTNFDGSLEAIVTAPDSTQSFYPSAAMTGLTSNSFSINLTLDRIGVYSLSVRNASNSVSNALTIDVRRSF